MDVIESLKTLLTDFPPDQVYLVGVSGGCDSVVLFHLLHHALGYRKLIVVHLNHQLRGEESNADAEFVRDLATEYGTPYEIGVADVSEEAIRDRLSLETAARKARQRFFYEAAQKHQSKHIFLAHHADDQVETVIMNVFRGSGIAGLQGMQSTGKLPHPDDRRPSIEATRPLLFLSRSDLVNYAKTHQLPYREDSSNTDPQHLRNRIRHELIPQIQDLFHRDIRPAILRLAEQSAAENDYFEATIASAAQQETLAVAPLRDESIAIQRRMIRAWLSHHHVSNISFQLVERARALLPREAKVAKINLPGARFLRRRKGVLFIETPDGSQSPRAVDSDPITHEVESFIMGKVFVVMGVSGSGKSTIAAALAEATDGAYYDGDDFHPASNVAKMRSGEPLTDEDRKDWLDRLAELLEACTIKPGFSFIACSALKQAYRDRLRKQGELPIRFIFLDAADQVLTDRMILRTDHFMPPSLLASQIATLERPENAITVDAALPVPEIVNRVLKEIIS